MVSKSNPSPAAFHKEMLNICNMRSDEWSDTIHARISGGFDLENGDVAFHKQCEFNFRTNRDIPSKKSSKQMLSVKRERSVGAIQTNERSDAFLVAMKYLESHTEEYVTIGEIQKIMADEGLEPYDSKWLRSRILNYFGSAREVLITRATNLNDHIVTLKTRSSSLILQDLYKGNANQQEPKNEEKEIIKAAANLIKQQTMSLLPNKEDFTLFKDLSDEQQLLDFVPECIRTFLDILFVGKHK